MASCSGSGGRTVTRTKIWYDDKGNRHEETVIEHVPCEVCGGSH